METKNLKTFIQVAERRSFTKAAEVLNYTQSTVSSQIKQLETELNTQLFERIHHKVTLTDRGVSLLNYAHQIINMIEEFDSNTPRTGKYEGLVRFAMAPSICNLMMGKTYMTFHGMYPDVAVKIMEAETEDMLHMLNHNDADLIFTVDRRKYTKEHIVASEKRVKMNFVSSNGFELCDKKNITIEELAGYPFILTEKELSYRKLFDEELAKRNLEIEPYVEIGNTHLLLELIELGGGVSYLPDYVTFQAYQEGKIEYLDVVDFDINIWRQLIYHKDKWISPAMRKVVEYCSAISEKL